jgi:small conductance mechanosensitive channel
MNINSETILNYFIANVTLLIDFLPTIFVAFFILIVGHYAINIFKKIVSKNVHKREFEPTLSKFLINILVWFLRILLFVTFISKLGIETASFVAIIGAAGLALGLSLQGSLSNFAGGILIILFKPFQLGDIIEAQGILGKVIEIQIFVTKLVANNNQIIFIPNGALSNGNIINHSMEGTRKAELFISVSSDSNLKKVKEIILEVFSKNNKILKTPKPYVEVLGLTETAIKLALKPWTKSEDFSFACSEILESCQIELTKNGIEFKNEKL